MPLLLKLETKSSPVRGISFHHKRQWILASLENGIIQHWDYKISSILREYKGHDGAVRGICFHKMDPVFVSGGDDKILKVWNVDDNKHICVLRGHTDIIRSCSFHHKFPWILSSSNGKTIRIWNWNIKQCVAKLIGHEMAVTGAMFHPSSSVVFSSSKDGSFRVWDITELENKETSIGKRTGAEEIKPIDTKHNISLDSNKKGLNSISFNEERELVVAGSDDNKLVLFYYDKEIKSLYYMRLYEGHDNIVNSATFLPYFNYLIGCSDDKTIRIFNDYNHKYFDILRYQNERFGVLAAHESSCLFAAGHENGMILFKNRRERPVFCVNDGFVDYLTSEKSVFRRLDLKINNDICRAKLFKDVYLNPRRSVSYNPVENALIVTRKSHDRKDCEFELYNFQSKGNGTSQYAGSGIQAFWIARNQFVVLNEHRKIELRDLSNSIICKLDIIADNIFYAGTGMILLKIEDEYKLFDVEKKKVTATVKLQDEVRYVIWSKSEEFAAVLSKKKLILLNRKLEILSIQEESNNVKSGCWIDASVFVYNTRYQVKYASTTGDTGVIKTLDKQLYIFSARGSTLCCFDKTANIVEVPIESFEYKLKLALFHGRPDEVLRLLESEHAKFVCQSMIAVLVKYGYLDIALTFVKDDSTRFILTLEFGNLEKALEFAERLDEYDAWKTLAEAALFQGSHKIAEICYLKTKNYEKLSFLYFVTGNIGKLKELMRIIDDPDAQFQITLFIGDLGERIRILKRCDQLSLAYLTAATHGYINEADKLKKGLEFKKRPLPLANSKFLAPPKPVHRLMENWPIVEFAGSLDGAGLDSSNTCEKVCEDKEKLVVNTEEELEELIEEKLDKIPKKIMIMKKYWI